MFFAQGRLKMILSSFVLTFTVNVAGDVLLIPIFKNEGAACAFLAACVVQSIFYLKKNTIPQLNTVWQPLLICILSALLCGLAATILIPQSWLLFPFAILLYVLLLFVFKQLKLSDGALLKKLLIR